MGHIRKNIKRVLKEYDKEELFDYTPNFSADELLKYIESEWDVEMLGLVNSKINERINFLTRIADMSNKKEVKGFRRYED